MLPRIGMVLPFTRTGMVTLPRRKTWGGCNDTALQVDNVVLPDASRIAVLINDIGGLEIQEPFAMLIDNLLLPSLDGHPFGSLGPGIGGASCVHRRPALARTIAEVEVTPTAFGTPPAAIRVAFIGHFPGEVIVLRFAGGRALIDVSDVRPPMATVYVPPLDVGVFSISHALIGNPPSAAAISFVDLGLCGADESNQCYEQISHDTFPHGVMAHPIFRRERRRPFSSDRTLVFGKSGSVRRRNAHR